MMIRLGEALTGVDRSAVVPPVLCRDCPLLPAVLGDHGVPVPLAGRLFLAADVDRCQMPASDVLPPAVEGFCHRAARKAVADVVQHRAQRCLRRALRPQARYWQARTYPAWLWAAGPVILGAAGLAAYAALLRLMLGGYP